MLRTNFEPNLPMWRHKPNKQVYIGVAQAMISTEKENLMLHYG